MSNDQKTTLEDFLLLLADIFEEPEANVTIDAERDSIEGWDSMGILSLIAALDDKFGILIDTTTIENFKSINDIVDVLRENDALIE